MAIDRDPRLPTAHNELGVLFSKQGKLTAAAESFRAAIEADKSYDAAHHNLGIIFLKQAKVEEARKCFKMALTVNPRNAKARYYLREVSKRLGRSKAAP
jgi:Tfp pilus assembly protein PilF